ncbi:MAG: hypothetical protein J1F18_02890 [Lachnospiraceae bacterium]|nr:hypothetical protein [Lachnospiraceae bacterium]
MPEEYDEREQQLYQTALEVLSDIWKNRLAVIKSDYEANSMRYDRDILDQMENLLQRWENMYSNPVGTLKYIIISPLNSGIITKSYELQIALFDQDLYINENPLCFYWSPEFIYKDVEKDMAVYRKTASKEIIRLREDEVNEVRRRYVLCHAYICMFYMDKIIREIFKTSIWKKVAADDVQVLYGTYMEQMVELGTALEEGE